MKRNFDLLLVLQNLKHSLSKASILCICSGEHVGNGRYYVVISKTVMFEVLHEFMHKTMRSVTVCKYIVNLASPQLNQCSGT